MRNLLKRILEYQIRFTRMEPGYRIDSSGNFYSAEIIQAEPIGIDPALLISAFGDRARIENDCFAIDCFWIDGQGLSSFLLTFGSVGFETFRGNVYRSSAGEIFIQGVFKQPDLILAAVLIWLNFVTIFAFVSAFAAPVAWLNGYFDVSLRLMLISIFAVGLLFAPKLVAGCMSLYASPSRRVVLTRLANMRN